MEVRRYRQIQAQKLLPRLKAHIRKKNVNIVAAQ